MDAKVEQKNELALLVEKSGLETETAKSLQEIFQPFLDQANQWKAKAGALVVTDVNQKREMQEARVARLALRDIRINVEKRRKDLKEDSLRKGKAIDSVANLLKGLIEPIEEHLEQQEKFAEVQEAKRKTELAEQRFAQLSPYGFQFENGFNLGEMDEQMFQSLFNGLKKTHEDKIEAERKAEEERIALEQEELKERERIRLENEELKRKQEEQERIMREERVRVEQERKAAEEAANKKLAEERQKAEAQQKKLREEQEKKLAVERKERERVEAELKAKQEAEIKAKAEAEALAEAELSKGDKAKFQDMINAMEVLKGKYTFKSKKYKALGASVEELLNKTINWAISKQ